MEDELPRNPPEQPKLSREPKFAAEVPEPTIFSPSSSKPATNRANFLQRANEKVQHHQPPKMSPQLVNRSPQLTNRSPQMHPVNNRPTYSNELPMKPSVPDLSLFDPQVLIQSNHHPNNKRNIARPNTAPATNFAPSKAGRSSKENIFGPSVPDVTILDEKPKEPQQKTSSLDGVFSESYKNKLISSHEEFMRQLNEDQKELIEQANHTKKKSNLFNPPVKYQENPLMKYAPKSQSQNLAKPQSGSIPQPDPNLSSILGNFDSAVHETEDKADDMTFKKVAAMLSEIKKLVIPNKSSARNSQEDQPKKARKVDVLRHLAATYLIAEELSHFDVESELQELEKSESEDS